MIGDSLTERGPVLIGIPTGQNEVIMAAPSTQNYILLLACIGSYHADITLSPPIPLDLPELNLAIVTY